MESTPAAIHLSYRPRRVAFLIDGSLERLEDILDAVLEFNVSSWGGRHNPILPLESGSLLPSYFPILDAADPDIICTFGDVQQDVVTQLTRRSRPLEIIPHGSYASDRVSISLSGDQVSVQHLLNSISAPPQRAFRYIDPCLIEFSLQDEHKISRFFRWNFGYSHLNHFAIRDHGVKPLLLTHDSDTSLVTQITASHNVVLNISVCGDAPLSMQLGREWQPAFTLFIGDRYENRLAYWNCSLGIGRISSFSPQRALWLGSDQLNDPDLLTAISRIPGLASGSSGYNSVLRLVSYEKTPDELRQIGVDFLKNLIVLAAPEGDDMHLTSFASRLARDGVRARIVTFGPTAFQATSWHYTY